MKTQIHSLNAHSEQIKQFQSASIHKKIGIKIKRMPLVFVLMLLFKWIKNKIYLLRLFRSKFTQDVLFFCYCFVYIHNRFLCATMNQMAFYNSFFGFVFLCISLVKWTFIVKYRTLKQKRKHHYFRFSFFLFMCGLVCYQILLLSSSFWWNLIHQLLTMCQPFFMRLNCYWFVVFCFKNDASFNFSLNAT